MSDLLKAACTTLEDPSGSPGLKTAACEALLAAADAGIPLPLRAAWLIWSWFTTAPSCRPWRSACKLGDMPDDRVRADAFSMLERRDAGDELRSVAVEVLSGKAYAREIDDQALLRLFEHTATGEHARDLTMLIEAVHLARGISPSILRAVRDRWAGSTAPAIRETAIAIAAAMHEPDVAFIAKMIDDVDGDVRMAMAHRIDFDFPGRELAGGIVEARLKIDTHPQVRASLLRAHSSLIEVMAAAPRRRRRR